MSERSHPRKSGKPAPEHSVTEWKSLGVDTVKWYSVSLVELTDDQLAAGAGTVLNAEETHEQRVRRRALSILGGKCVKCGEDDPAVLDIDHKLGGGTRERRAGRHHRQLWRAIINGSADTNLYQILCANCHRRKDYDTKRYPTEDQEK